MKDSPSIPIISSMACSSTARKGVVGKVASVIFLLMGKSTFADSIVSGTAIGFKNAYLGGDGDVNIYGRSR